MRITAFELASSRCVESTSLEFAAKTTALVGGNVVGKSSLLDALAISLSNPTARVTGQPAQPRSVSVDDICIGAVEGTAAQEVQSTENGEEAK